MANRSKIPDPRSTADECYKILMDDDLLVSSIPSSLTIYYTSDRALAYGVSRAGDPRDSVSSCASHSHHSTGKSLY